MLRLDRLSNSKTGLVGRSPPSIFRKRRAGSPDGGSILTTSAPQSARIPPVAGPATHTPNSTTRTPSIGPDISASLSPVVLDADAMPTATRRSRRAGRSGR